MKILANLKSWADDRFDEWENKKELNKWNKLIKKACKKYSIRNKQFLFMYSSIQKEFLERINDRDLDGVHGKEDFKDTLFNTIVEQRIYDLNREFIFLVNGEFHNSLYALTRQIVEIYIRLIQCRYDRAMLKRLLEEERQKTPIKNTIENLKKKATFPYLKETKDDKFLESVLGWFNYFSNLYHFSGISLSQNMWVSNEYNSSTKLYIQQPKLEKGDSLLIFSKKSVVTDKRYRILIHQFYTFTGLSIKELKLLEIIS